MTKTKRVCRISSVRMRVEGERWTNVGINYNPHKKMEVALRSRGQVEREFSLNKFEQQVFYRNIFGIIN